METIEELAQMLCSCDRTPGIRSNSVVWMLGDEMVAYYSPFANMVLVSAHLFCVLWTDENYFTGDDACYLLENG